MRAVVRLGAAILGLALTIGTMGALSPQTPATAAAPEGAAGTFAAFPLVGEWGDGTGNFYGRLTCPVPPAEYGTLVEIKGRTALARAGEESPVIDGARPADDPGLWAATIGKPLGWTSFNAETPPAPFDVFTGTTPQLHDWMAGTWTPATDPESMVPLQSVVEPGAAYSLVHYCSYFFDGGDGLVVVPNEQGRISATWQTFDVTETGWEFQPEGSPTSLSVTYAPGAVEGSLTATVQVLDGATGQPANEANGLVLATAAEGNVSSLPPIDLVGGQVSIDLQPADPAMPISTVPLQVFFFPEMASPFAASETIATYTPPEEPEPEPAPLLESGDTAAPGTEYRIEAPNGTFTSGDTLEALIQPGNVSAIGTGTVTPEGAVTWTFTMPAVLTDGAYTLYLRGTPSGASLELPFVVGEETDPGGDPGDGDGGGTPGGSTVTPAANAGFTALTDWLAASASTPAGLGTMLGVGVLVTAGLLGGWALVWRRRRTATDE